jgi:hypothetical protein
MKHVWSNCDIMKEIERRSRDCLRIDPGSERTGYGCVTSDGQRHRLVQCGIIEAGAVPTRLRVSCSSSFAD